MSNKDTRSKKRSAMATSAQKPKSAMATLAESFENLVESQRKELSKEEFKKAEENFDRIVSKARASRARRRETA
jgi:ribosomal protein S20